MIEPEPYRLDVGQDGDCMMQHLYRLLFPWVAKEQDHHTVA